MPDEHLTDPGADCAPGSGAPVILVVAVTADRLGDAGVLLAGLPPDLPLAVLVARAGNAEAAEAQFRASLGENKIRLCIAENGLSLAPGAVHLLPPDRVTTVTNGRLVIGPVSELAEYPATLNMLFASLASGSGRQTVAIRFRGLRKDGAAGLAFLQGSGGLVLAEDDVAAERHGVRLASFANAVGTLPELTRRIAAHVHNMLPLNGAVRDGSEPAFQSRSVTPSAAPHQKPGAGFHDHTRRSETELASARDGLGASDEKLTSSDRENHRLHEARTKVNGELARRAAELAHGNSDLKNAAAALQIPAVLVDRTLRITHFSDAARECFDLDVSDIGQPIAHIEPRIVYDRMQDDVHEVMRTLVASEREIENPGTQTRYGVRMQPYRGLDEAIAGVIVAFSDVTPLSVAQAALRQSEARLRQVTECVPQLVWTALENGAWTWSGAQWTEQTGQAEQDSRDFGWMDRLHPDDVAPVQHGWDSAPALGGLDLEHRLRMRDGSYRWFHTRAVPLVHSEEAHGVEWFGTCTDMHDLHELREQNSVLVAELQHRTRNLLAVVKSLSEKTLAGSVNLEDFQERFSPRLEALSRVQGLLSRLHDEERVHFDQLLRAELTAHGANDVAGSNSGPKIIFDGPSSVRLRSSSVQILALALHELATNATKYGALSDTRGTLRVTWRIARLEDGERRLRVVWEETGSAQAQPPSQARRGYGRTLIEQALPYQLKARTDYQLSADGVTCAIDLPVPDDGGAARG